MRESVHFYSTIEKVSDIRLEEVGVLVLVLSTPSVRNVCPTYLSRQRASSHVLHCDTSRRALSDKPLTSSIGLELSMAQSPMTVSSSEDGVLFTPVERLGCFIALSEQQRTLCSSSVALTEFLLDWIARLYLKASMCKFSLNSLLLNAALHSLELCSLQQLHVLQWDISGKTV